MERELDLSAQDLHHKYERPSFVVVTASAAFRDGWDRIFNRSAGHPDLDGNRHETARRAP